MSEDRTQNLPNDDLRQILAQLTLINSRLDRMDARFDRVDVRLDSMDARLERLEARDYDTKPIWENALKEIADTRAEMRQGFEQVNARVDKLEASVDKLQKEVRESRSEATAEMRKAVRQIDVLNHNLLGSKPSCARWMTACSSWSRSRRKRWLKIGGETTGKAARA
jgi:chromosome segregation ATPase